MSQQKKKNALTEFKLRLTCPPLEGALVKWDRPQEPTFAVGVVDNQPRFTVYTNVDGDKDNGRIEGNMDSFTFYAVLAAIRKVAKDDSFKGAMEISNRGHYWSAGKRSDEPGIKSTTVVGRDGEGSVFISLTAGKNRPMAKFVFKPTEFHGWSRGGEAMSRSEVTSLYALGQADLMGKLVANILVDEHITYEEIKARKEANKRNNGGGGGYNGGGNKPAGGGYNAPKPDNSDFDKDIPW